MDADDTSPSIVGPWTPARWRDQIESAHERVRAVADRGIARLRVLGLNYSTDWEQGPDDLTSPAYAIVQMLLPALSYSAPRVTLHARGMADPAEVRANEWALNAWLTQSDFARTLNRACMRHMADAAVFVVGSMTDPDGLTLRELASMYGVPIDPAAESPMLDALAEVPYAAYVPTERFLIDPRAEEWEQAAWAGHIMTAPVSEMLAALDSHDRPVYDEHAIKACARRGAGDDVRAAGKLPGMLDTHIDDAEVVYVEAWHRVSGTIVCLGVPNGDLSAEPIALRPARPYKGHPDGPYVVAGTTWIPGRVLPLAPLAPIDRMVEEVNLHRGQIRDDAGAAKRLLVVQDEATRQMLESAPNLSVVTASDPSDKGIRELVIGGAQEANILQADRLMADIERTVGVSAVAQGQLGQADTATEVADASARMDARIARMQASWRAGVVEVLERVLVLIADSPQYRNVIHRRTPGGVHSSLYVGGGSDQSGSAISRMAIDIVPYSMEFVGDNQLRRRHAEMFQGLVQMGQAMQTMPWINWQQYYQLWAESLNLGPSAESLIDWDAFGLTQRMQAASAGMAQSGVPPTDEGGPTSRGPAFAVRSNAAMSRV